MFSVEHWSVRLFLNISLVIVYIFTFGKNSVEKYLDGGVIISTKTIQDTEIEPPGTGHIKHFIKTKKLINL